jgi:4-hydroxybenzoate polyprenyltransferase
LPVAAWVLMAATFFWIIAYDTEYAMVDRGDDIKIGVHSSAILFGRYDVAAVMACQAAFLAIMAVIGVWYQFDVIYYFGIALAAAVALSQYRLIREREREKCFRAFVSNGWLGGLIFAGIALEMLLRIRVFR